MRWIWALVRAGAGRLKRVRRFGLRTLLVVVTLCGVGFGMLTERRREHLRTRAALEEVADVIKTRPVRVSAFQFGTLHELEELVRGPARQVVEVGFLGPGADDEALAVVAKLKHVESLSLERTSITDAGLAATRLPASLRTLELVNNPAIQTLPVAALARCPRLATVKIVGVGLGAAELEWLAGSGIRHLTLARTGIEDAELLRLAGSESLLSLHLEEDLGTELVLKLLRSLPALRSFKSQIVDTTPLELAELRQVKVLQADFTLVDPPFPKEGIAAARPGMTIRVVERRDELPPLATRIRPELAYDERVVTFPRVGRFLAGFSDGGVLVCYGRAPLCDGEPRPDFRLCNVQTRAVQRVRFSKRPIVGIELGDDGISATVYTADPGMPARQGRIVAYDCRMPTCADMKRREPSVTADAVNGWDHRRGLLFATAAGGAQRIHIEHTNPTWSSWYDALSKEHLAVWQLKGFTAVQCTRDTCWFVGVDENRLWMSELGRPAEPRAIAEVRSAALPRRFQELLAFQDGLGYLCVVTFPELREVLRLPVAGMVEDIVLNERLAMVAWTEEDEAARVVDFGEEWRAAMQELGR